MDAGLQRLSSGLMVRDVLGAQEILYAVFDRGSGPFRASLPLITLTKGPRIMTPEAKTVLHALIELEDLGYIYGWSKRPAGGHWVRIPGTITTLGYNVARGLIDEKDQDYG